MEKIKTFATINYNEFMRRFDALNPLSTHAKEEVDKEVDFTKAAMADVKNQVAQYNLGPNPERAAIFNKIETLFGQMRVHPRPVTYWNRTQEEALSYHLHNSHSTAKKLRSLVKDLWKTVKDDKVEKDLQEYRQKKLHYMTKKEAEERKNYETGGKLSGVGGEKGHVSAEDAGGLRREERDFHGGKKFEGSGSQGSAGTSHKQPQQGKTHDYYGTYHQPQQHGTGIQGTKFDGFGSQGAGTKDLRGEPIYQQQQGKKFDDSGSHGHKDVRGEERNYDGGRMQGAGDRVGGSYVGSEYALGDDKRDHGDYQFQKLKQTEGYQKEGYTHPPATTPEQPRDVYQKDYGYYNNPPYFPDNTTGYSFNPPDNLQGGQRRSNMGAGV
jgi:hypothetical protein